MMNKKFSKRGEIPIVVLVIGIFAVCSLALISFFMSDIRVKESFIGLDTMQKINIQIENATFHNLSPDNFYLEKKINESNWYFFEETEKLLFSVRYKIPPK